jgi:3-methyladenine DNA glycosylase AlkD
MDAAKLIDQVTDQLAAIATPERAEREKAYLKSELRFLGATVPQIQAAAKAAVKRMGKLERGDLQELTRLCFASDLHEHRSLACALLQSNAKKLNTADLAWLAEAIDASKTWAYVDVIAVHPVGSIAARHPQEALAELATWTVHGNFWRRRSALLALMGAGGPKRRLRASCLRLGRYPCCGKKSSLSARRSAGCCAKSPRAIQTMCAAICGATATS